MDKFLKNLGFNEDGITYIYKMSDSFFMKHLLKEDGFKFHPLLLWHIPNPPDIAETEDFNYKGKLAEVKWTDLYDKDEYGKYSVKEDAAAYVNSLIEKEKVNENSKHIFSVGEKITKVPMTLIKVFKIDGAFGESWVHKFDCDGNTVEWFTTTGIRGCVNAKYLVSGTVKTHTEYKDEKITVITRARLEDGVLE
jgi:hypothetical protein